ncbi:hypothetical protein [Brevibacillus thermoruber]|uniref:hypothetical protein n=1 Tax=Brevibacillus thermoruber TaxID=33942 RepID=UPI0012E04B46|nr:hypothetical protein [Brevibacillus thermoruber]
MKKRSTRNKRAKKNKWARAGVHILFWCLSLLLAYLWISLEDAGEFGQFAKFVIHTVILSNLFGLFSILLGIGFAGFAAYKLITRTAYDPKKTVLYSIPLFVFFVGLGAFLTKDLSKNMMDVKHYVTGHIVEERVVITHFTIYENNHGEDGYEYTFSDGRTFYENHEGNGFDDITVGQAYVIRYLPETPKLLSIKPAE